MSSLLLIAISPNRYAIRISHRQIREQMMPIQFYCAQCTICEHTLRVRKVCRTSLFSALQCADFIYFRHSSPISHQASLEIRNIRLRRRWVVRYPWCDSSIVFPALSLSLFQFTVVGFVQLSVINIFCWQVVGFLFHLCIFFSFVFCCYRTAPASASQNPKPNRTAPHRTAPY